MIAPFDKVLLPVKGGIMLVLPLALYFCGDDLFIDNQALNGLRLWAENFGHVTLCAQSVSVDEAPPGTGSFKMHGQVDVLALPQTYDPISCLRALPSVWKTLAKLIRSHEHLQFAIGGVWGDWGALAAIIAWRMQRPAAIWTDRVESKVMTFQAQEKRGFRRWYSLMNAKLAAYLERFVIRRSALGLFHGGDTFEAYSSFSPRPHLVHDIHLGPDALISESELQTKLARTGALDIIYIGRAHRDKGISDWIKCLLLLNKLGVEFKATWYGDGPDLELARLQSSDLGERVEFPGALHDREALLARLRASDIFMFCHKTPESPRCLIESLICGTPIIGYKSHYPADLIKKNGGGILTYDSHIALSDIIRKLDRNYLSDLTQRAALDGHDMTDTITFRHRSELIKDLTNK